MCFCKKKIELAKQRAQIPRDEVKRKIICVTMSELYYYVAKAFGLDVGFKRVTVDEDGFEAENEVGGLEILKHISEEELDHVCPIAHLKDGRAVTVDIQADLDALQTRSTPRNFVTEIFGTNNPIELDTLPQEQIDAIFKKVYGLKPEEKFTDKYIESLNRSLTKQKLEPIEKIRRIIEDTRIQKEVKKTRNKRSKRIL